MLSVFKEINVCVCLCVCALNSPIFMRIHESMGQWILPRSIAIFQWSALQFHSSKRGIFEESSSYLSCGIVFLVVSRNSLISMNLVSVHEDPLTPLKCSRKCFGPCSEPPNLLPSNKKTTSNISNLLGGCIVYQMCYVAHQTNKWMDAIRQY